jgi:hypothetical protein
MDAKFNSSLWGEHVDGRYLKRKQLRRIFRRVSTNKRGCTATDGGTILKWKEAGCGLDSSGSGRVS